VNRARLFGLPFERQTITVTFSAWAGPGYARRLRAIRELLRNANKID